METFSQDSLVALIAYDT
ncbi:hypothetical protein RDI58_026805 [Solanum bulbocastanum]|uniref:Uncharacterized protein n=1 Tax=Solanum bulbocastanum TaxID=147425 RepID=A0AAN8SXL3_SOLBU